MRSMLARLFFSLTRRGCGVAFRLTLSRSYCFPAPLSVSISDALQFFPNTTQSHHSRGHQAQCLWVCVDDRHIKSSRSQTHQYTPSLPSNKCTFKIFTFPLSWAPRRRRRQATPSQRGPAKSQYHRPRVNCLSVAFPSCFSFIPSFTHPSPPLALILQIASRFSFSGVRSREGRRVFWCAE
ncbi:hypothetical protein C8R43DRAFT_1051298 [Mycena crocata]|nr:hypothetical protein C8R43DRAFT_1051298 [Mycena crocata]